MGSLFKYYQNLLMRRPYLVQAIQTGVLMGTGDVISQIVVEKMSWNRLDYSRTLKFSAVGFFMAGPTLRAWYGILNKYIGSSGKTVALKKVVIDQVLFAPSFLLSLLVIIAAMQGKDQESIKKDVEANYLDVLKANYSIWPFVQIINFTFVPLQYQVLLVQSIALFWNTYLSWKTNQQREISNTKY